jgi:cytidylate kinase
MDASLRLDRCISFINAQSHALRDSRHEEPGIRQRPVVTISRQAGSGAHVVAERLVAQLQAQAPTGAPRWTVFDRNTVEKVLEEHDLPARLAPSMPEDRVTEMADTMDQLFGLRPSSWTLVRKTAETILHLAEIGNVVVVGRGGNLVTGKLASAVHVRLVGSLERRIDHAQEANHLDRKAAAAYVHDEDLGRRRYVEKYYDADIDDPLLYHLVINTDRVPYAEAASLIAGAVSARMQPSERSARTA